MILVNLKLNFIFGEVFKFDKTKIKSNDNCDDYVAKYWHDALTLFFCKIVLAKEKPIVLSEILRLEIKQDECFKFEGKDYILSTFNAWKKNKNEMFYNFYGFYEAPLTTKLLTSSHSLWIMDIEDYGWQY